MEITSEELEEMKRTIGSIDIAKSIMLEINFSIGEWEYLLVISNNQNRYYKQKYKSREISEKLFYKRVLDLKREIDSVTLSVYEYSNVVSIRKAKSDREKIYVPFTSTRINSMEELIELMRDYNT